MTGLKLLADQVDAKMMSRATTGHAASIGVSGALSFSCAGALAAWYDWPAAFIGGGLSAALAWLIVAIWVPRRPPRAPAADGGKLFDFRPVFRNRSAMAYSIAYCVHTLEMSALRGWGVAFLGFVAASAGAADSLLAPTAVLTALGLIGTAASVLGNEAAIRRSQIDRPSRSGRLVTDSRQGFIAAPMVGQFTPGLEDRAVDLAETCALVADASLCCRREHQRRGVGRVGDERL
jgi:predicted MFS family arabinose efflux permease